jgi:Tol biopolymer transport system component
MALAPGTRLGAYEILSLLGKGGMGEVYRARDTKLDREVAFKVLPEAFVSDPERVARFQREAKALAALNHPHIGGIYGFEDAEGVRALVLELVDGPTLADRIAQGAIPLEEALPIAKQIAEALEAAHEAGIIHRDLKPANIKVRPDGTVKVLDFGLAKALEPAPGVSASVTASPTITTPAMMTGIGIILGTAAYMSPEQAKGRPADKRSDVWAFGCVLYEMLTGVRTFPGDDVSDTLAAVLRGEPDWRALPATPAPIRRLLRRCLEKDRRRRLADVADVRLEIEEALATPDLPAMPTTGSRMLWQRGASIAAVALVAGGIAAGGAVWIATRPAPARVTRTTLQGAGATVAAGSNSVVITPDGSSVVYRAAANQLYVRRLDQLDPVALGSAGNTPFVAPDGQWVGFFEATALKKVPITGGPPVTVYPISGAFGGAFGAVWGADGTIVFATGSPGGLRRVSAAGGEAETLTTIERAAGAIGHRWPEFLPDGRSLLFTISSLIEGRPSADVALLDMATRTQTVLIRGGSRARYLPTGHLVYGTEGTLRAVRFDLERKSVVGAPVPVLTSVGYSSTTVAYEYDVAADGTLVYRPGGGDALSVTRTLVWVDRQDRETPVDVTARPYLHPRLAPDGTRLVVLRSDGERDLWVFDLASRLLTRATYGPAADTVSVWMPDSRRLVFGSNRVGVPNLYMQAADGTGETTRLTESPNPQQPSGLTPDGRQVLFYEVTPNQQRDIKLLTLTPAAHVEPLLATPFDERGGVVSPDGRWLAYESNSSGQYETYVRPFPAVDVGQSQVSTGGGFQPLWSRNGRELFYVAPDGALMAVAVQARGATWSAGAPTRLIAGRYFRGGEGTISRQYDITADGQRFLMLKDERRGADADPSIIVVQHWFEELKARVPTK